MIAELGLAALWLAGALAALQLALSVMVLKGAPDLDRLVRPAALAQAVLACLAFAALITLFVRIDLSVALVAANDHSEKPLLYRFSGAWGNHEGSMLMWVSILSVAGGRWRCSNGGCPNARCWRRWARRRRSRSASTPFCCSPPTRSGG